METRPHAGGKVPPTLRITIGADHGEAARAGAAFAGFADAHGLPAAVRRSMSIVLDELLSNSITHGLAGREGGEVTVAVELLPDRLHMTLTDNGRPFDPFGKVAPDTSLAVEERPIGGLGIHLVRRLVDEATYERRGEHNVVVLAKRLAGDTVATRPGGRLMNIGTRALNDVTVVAIAGNLDSNTSPQAQQAFDTILAAGGKKIAVDFTALDYISSAGLRVLLGTAKRLNTAGGALRVFGLNDTVREVFEISGFSTILAVFPTEAEALAGF